jgi:hypothetical protein
VLIESYKTKPSSERRRSSLVTDIVNAEKGLVNQRRRQSITERKKSLVSDVTITSPEQAARNARRMSWTPVHAEVGRRGSWVTQQRGLDLTSAIATFHFPIGHVIGQLDRINAI